MRKLMNRLVRPAWIVVMALVASLTFATGATAQSSTMEDILSRGELRVAVQTQGPPVSFVDESGERTGLAIELVRMMADDMGVELVLQDYSWQGLIPALLSGKADLIAADMTTTPKRATRLLFTEPIFFTSTIAYTTEDTPYESWEDLNNAEVTVGAPQATTYAAAARDNLPNASLKEYQGGTPVTAQALDGGRVDAAISDTGTIKAFLEDYPNFRVLDGTLRKEPLSFATRPDSVHLLMFMDTYIRFIRNTGQLETVLDYWWRSSDWEQDH